MAEAAPFPILQTFAQSGAYRIAMNIAKLLQELRVVAHVEIVIAFLPEMVPTQAKIGLEWGTLLRCATGFCAGSQRRVSVAGAGGAAGFCTISV